MPFVEVREHRDAAKDLRRIPVAMREAFDVVRNELASGAVPADLRETIPRGRGRQRRLFYIWGRSYQGTTYGMAWERGPGTPGEPERILV